MKILVVDDQSANRAILQFLLEDEGHEVVEAKDGQEALDLYQEHDIDLVLMDVMMPVMDGLEATQKIKAIQTDGNHVPIIFLTAQDDDKALTKCLQSGGDDFLAKPYNEVVLKAKITAHGRIREQTVVIRKNNEELTQYNNLWEREQNIVAHIFGKAMEHNLSGCDNLKSYIAPASTFNGDILLSAPSPAGGLYVFLGDFTGHGLGASIGTLPVAHSFDQLARRHLSVGDIAFELNQMLTAMLPDYMFCCATILELNPKGDSVQIWMGGLPDAYAVAADGTIKSRICSRSMPLGIESDDSFDKGFEVKKLAKGERVMFFTDGIVEAENPEGEFYEEERLEACFKPGVKEPLDSVLTSLKSFIKGAEQRDDITVVEVSSGAVKLHDTETSSAEQSYDGILWKMETNLGALAMQKGDAVEEIMSIIGSQTLLRPNKDMISLLLTELYSNALEHGILELSSELKSTEEGFVEYYQQRQTRLENLSDANIDLRLELINEQELMLRINLSDSGKGFEFSDVMASSQDDSFGRGLALIKRVCKRMEYSNGGRTVEVDFPVSYTQDAS